MNSLLFLTNDLQSPRNQAKTMIPLTYIGPALMEGKMYRNGKDSFIVQNGTRITGNRVVYGTLYMVQNFEHYVLALDALHDCSKSLIGRNHTLDLQHREICDVTLIDFDSIDNFKILCYNEQATVQTHVYLANITHTKIKNKMYNKNNVYRIQSGVRKGFIEQWEEEHG